MKGGNKYAAEFIGTFALVFAGTGAIIINDVSGGAVTSVSVGNLRDDCSDDDLCRGRCLRSALQPGGNARLFRGAPA